MSLDVVIASHVAGGESFFQAPVEVRGLYVEPPSETLSSQVTGDGTTTLRARYTGGRVRIFDRVKDFTGDEVNVAVQSGSQLDYGAGSLSSGNAIWFTLVATQHRVSGAIGLVWVPGAIAAVASVAKPTDDEIRSYLDLATSEQWTFVKLGSIRFYRSADTTIVHQTDSSERPSCVDTAKKTAATADAVATDGLEERFWGYIEIPITLASAFALAAGDLYAAPTAPWFPYGGKIVDWEYIGAVSGAGAGADMTMKLQIDGVEVTGSSIQLLLANTAVSAGGSKVGDAGITAAHIFKPKSVIGIEVDAKPTAFTAGSGVLRIAVMEFVPVRS
jgi:hypothetical protein